MSDDVGTVADDAVHPQSEQTGYLGRIVHRPYDDLQPQLASLLEGYEQFYPFDRGTLALIEPLRFMRMIYFLAWRARQRNDYWFRDHFPQWGTEAFWIKETEDLKEQARVVRAVLE